MFYCVIFASAYISAGSSSLKQNGVFTLVITSGYTDLRTAHSTHIGCEAGYCSFFVDSRVTGNTRRTAEEASLPAFRVIHFPSPKTIGTFL